MFRKILIANRGEIAMRVLRAAREMGIRTVAVHSEADAHALHVRFADEAVCIGPAAATKSYLHIPAIVSAAEITGADAIHPGYGFLAERADFAEICARCGLTFIGPTPEAMRRWGDKVRARAEATRLGIPLLPGTGVLRDLAQAEREAAALGFPLMLKASGGGGGRGMRVLRSVDDLRAAYAGATTEALAAFGNGDLFMERYVEEPRHVEMQVLADAHGHVVTLGERECSLQRRHQKLVEEAPCLAMGEERRAALSEVIRHAMTDTGYTTVGTLEFLMDERGEMYFLEMNTRLQVEHPVTEVTTGVDLVKEQIRAAAGDPLEIGDTRGWRFRGHAIECRVNAEDPDTFAPSPGLVTEYHPPGGGGIRVDSGIYGGFRVPPNYDSLLTKVIAHAPTREQALVRMDRALAETIIGGIKTNIPFLRRLLADAEVRAGKTSTRTVERVLAGR